MINVQFSIYNDIRDLLALGSGLVKTERRPRGAFSVRYSVYGVRYSKLNIEHRISNTKLLP